jgi:hypothetical protein
MRKNTQKCEKMKNNLLKYVHNFTPFKLLALHTTNLEKKLNFFFTNKETFLNELKCEKELLKN